jgi:hypothetical protein
MAFKNAETGTAGGERSGAFTALGLAALGVLSIAAFLAAPQMLDRPAAPAAVRPVLSSLWMVPDASDPGRITARLQGPAAEALRERLGAEASPRQVEELFYVAVKPAAGREPLPMLARLEWSGDAGVLTPQASLTPGLTYVAAFLGSRLGPGLDDLRAEHTASVSTESSPARVTAVYPSQQEVPANLLKFYLRFSEPMAQGEVFRHARLLDEGGKPVEQAFREVELWAEGHRRLTLWINPGRTKRALGLSESLGPVLEEHRSYTLEISPGLKDQKGRPISSGFRHPFRTAGHDRDQPRINEWAVQAPRPETREPLQVRFPEPMDHALAGRLLEVLTGLDEPVTGRIELSDDAVHWRFTPDQPWETGEYVLAAGGALEDLAGNSLLRPFETAPGKGPKPAAEPPLFRRTFTVTAAGL